MRRVIFLVGFIVLLFLLVVGCSKESLPQNVSTTDNSEQAAQEQTPAIVEEQPSEEAIEDVTEPAAPDVPAPEPVKEETPVEPVVQANATVPVGKTHTVTVTNTGFSPKSLTIEVGDTVVWKNTRNLPGKQSYAYLFGARGACKRPVLEDKYPPGLAPGGEFSFTFTEKQDCVYVDGIQTTQSGTIVVK